MRRRPRRQPSAWRTEVDDLLTRHVRRFACRISGLGQAGEPGLVEQFTQAEVTGLGNRCTVAALAKQDVARGEIAMDDAAAVGMVQSVEHPHDKRDRLVRGHAAPGMV